MSTKRIGVLVGWEDGFPQAFIERINKTPGFHGEFATLGATMAEGWRSPYAVLVDRISHEVPFYRFHLKAAMLSGTYVVNDPLWWSGDDKFFGFSLASRMGVAVPRTVMLPQRDYLPSIDKRRSLRNLEFPLDWEAIARYVGFPAILKPADGGGWKNVSRVDSMRELLEVYNDSGTLVMTLQQFIDFEDYVRCVCIGRDHICIIRYDPKRRCYLPDKNWLDKKLETRIIEDARKINHALGYDMNSVEFAIKDGVPYAIDFTNPAPDMYPHHVLQDNFDWGVEAIAQFCIEKARIGKPNDGGYPYQRYLAALEAGAPAAMGSSPKLGAGVVAIAGRPVAR